MIHPGSDRFADVRSDECEEHFRWGRGDHIIAIDKPYNLSKLDVSQITDMGSLFEISFFNGDISKWDVSNVTSMYGMFYSTSAFNQPLSSWNTSNVTSMVWMFYKAESFNQALDSWDMSNVTDMGWMFYYAHSFNKRFNNCVELPEKTEEIKLWFEENRDNMMAIAFNDSLTKQKN